MNSKPTKILIVFHCAGDPPARKIFEPFSQLENVQLKVLGPQRSWLAKDKTQNTANYELILGKTFGEPKPAGNSSFLQSIYDRPYKTGLFKLIKEFKPDIIQLFSEAFSAPVAQTIFYKNLVSPKSKVFFYAFENMPNSYQRITKNKLLGCYWNYIRTRVAGGTAANMEAIELLVQMGIPRERIRRVFWGVPLDNFSPKEVSPLKAKLGLKEEFVVGYVGRLIPEKGIDLLINALSCLPKEYKLLLLGRGESLAALQAQWENLNLGSRIIHVPSVANEQVVNYLNCMDVLVVPSRRSQTWKEQYGRVIPEAMASGVPVIGSSSGAIPEVISDAGLVFAEDDRDKDLADKIRLIKEDVKLRKSLVEKGLARAQNEFSGQAFARKHLEFYLSS